MKVVLPWPGRVRLLLAKPKLLFALDLHDLAVVHDDRELAEAQARQRLANAAQDLVLVVGRIAHGQIW
jgi:hypothetical protein